LPGHQSLLEYINVLVGVVGCLPASRESEV